MARHCLQLLGRIVASTFVISHARLHIRCLQTWFSTVYRLNKDGLDKPLYVPSRVKHFLGWWKDGVNVSSGIPFTQPLPALLLTTDASLIGWDAYLNNLVTQGKWSLTEATFHINLLELRR